MANSQIVQTETLRSVANGSISSSYVAIGTPFANPVRILVMTNNTNGDLIVSDDGANGKYFLPKNSFLLFDYNTNRKNVDQEFVYAEGTQLWVKQSSAPSTGDIWVAVVYGENPAFVVGAN